MAEKIELGSWAHGETSRFLQHWSDELREVIWRTLDCLEEDQYEARLLRHGLWTMTVQRDSTSDLILCVIIAHTMSRGRMTWLLGADTPYQDLIQLSSRVLKSMTKHNQDRNAL